MDVLKMQLQRAGVIFQDPAVDGPGEGYLAEALEEIGASGSFVGTYANTTLLEASKPAATNGGNTALVGASAPYMPCVSNGVAWVAQLPWPAGTAVEDMAEGDLVVVIA